MFKGGRDFRLIAFTSPIITTTEEVVKSLPYWDISNPIELVSDNPDYSFKHYYFYRETAYFPSHGVPDNEAKGLFTKHNGVDVFQYNFYIAKFSIDSLTQGGEATSIFLIAVPFTAMAIELFSEFKNNSKGLKVQYLKIDIEALVCFLKSGDNLEGDIKMTKLELDIEGDSPTKSAVLAGSDVPNSITYKSVIQSLNKMAVAHRKCKLIYDDRVNKRLVIIADMYGNYTVPLNINGMNLPFVATVFKYLQSLSSCNNDVNKIVNKDVLFFNSILPSLKTLQDEED